MKLLLPLLSIVLVPSLVYSMVSDCEKLNMKLISASTLNESAELKDLIITHANNISTLGKDTALRWACSNENEELVKFLIEHGANVNAQDQYGSTPLYFAALKGNSSIMKLLLEAGADVNAQEVLNKAITAGKASSVKLLIEAGANVRIKDLYNKTPLELAAELGYNAYTGYKNKDYEEIIGLLARVNQEQFVRNIMGYSRTSSM